MTDRVLDAASGRVDAITVGTDLWCHDTERAIELVAVFDVAARDIVGWTGKSYPVPSQEKTLVQVSDLGPSHGDRSGGTFPT